MTYKSQSYHALEAQISRLDRAKDLIDTAKTFRSMKFGGSMTVSTGSKMYQPSDFGVHSVTLKDGHLKQKTLDMLAEYFEVEAEKVMAEEVKDFDVKEATKC